ncbi:MAG: response regulator transcription factor [Actinobacteria bacterium]|nr:response regulator transcription factor [Actinomycetota bacterium]
MKILLAIKDRLVRSALKSLIRFNCTDDIAMDAADHLNFLEQLRNNKNDLVILEREFFFDDNPEMIILLKKAYPEINFIVTGINRESQREAIDAKMDAFYMQSDSPERLVELINGFRRGKKSVSDN